MRSLASVVLLVAIAIPVAVPAHAQYGGPRASYGRDAGLTVPHVATPIAALAVRHGGDLQLSQTQLDSLLVVRQFEDSLNAPWLRTLDSLRNGPRPANPLDLSQEQRELLASRRAAVKSAVDAIAATNAQARERVMAVLSVDQQRKAARLENDARKLARARTERRAEDDSYLRRRGDMNELTRPRPED